MGIFILVGVQNPRFLRMSYVKAPKCYETPSFAECVFEETNFLGGGLSKAEGGQGLPTASHEECSLECQQRSKCTHWEGHGYI